MTSTRVIIGVSCEISSDLDYTHGLGEALAELRCDASILLTGSGEQHEPAATSVRHGVPVHRSPAHVSDGLAEYWLELIRFLEESAPCLYLCAPSGLADWIYPRLSSRILVVPILHRDDGTAYEYSRSLAGSFDALVPLNASLRQRLLADISDLAPRLATLPASPLEKNGLRDGGSADFIPTAKACLRLAGELAGAPRALPHLRKRGRMLVPTAVPVEVASRASLESAAQFVNKKPRWPDPVEGRSPGATGNVERGRPPSSLENIRIVVGLTSGRISGVDIFSINLVRELRRLGLRAELLQSMAGTTTDDSLPLPPEIQSVGLSLPELPTWRQRWANLKDYLESEPTIYLPNYDDRHSAVIPTLASHVRAVGIGHSDDPHYYQHISRLAPYWDAVVAVSSTIANHLTGLSPEIEERLSVVPYGVSVPPVFQAASRAAGDALQAVYTGRLVQYQKRVFDLARIAEEAAASGLNVDFTIAGDGPDADAFFQRAGGIKSRTMKRAGSVANDDVLKIFANSHAFVLSSSFEGLPVSLLEAMANGCVPVVAAIRSGVPDLIDDGRNGFLFPIGDTAAATGALIRIARDEDLRVTLAHAAYETIRSRYTIEHMSKQYVEVFERILSAPYRRPVGRLSPPRSIHALDANMPPFPLPLRKLIAAARERIS